MATRWGREVVFAKNKRLRGSELLLPAPTVLCEARPPHTRKICTSLLSTWHVYEANHEVQRDTAMLLSVAATQTSRIVVAILEPQEIRALTRLTQFMSRVC